MLKNYAFTLDSFFKFLLRLRTDFTNKYILFMQMVS